MIKRLIEIRPTLNEILEELGIDTLLSSEWTKLENLMKLLEPFAAHTDQLQTDSQSLSEVVPALLNLEAHLQQTTMEKKTVQVLLSSIRQCFAGILDPTHAKFDPAAGAASLMDPSVSLALASPEMQHLKRAAEIFVLDQALRYSQTSTTMTDDACELPSTSGGTNKTLQKYSFLATKIYSTTTNQVNPVDNSGSAVHEMQKYLDEVKRDNIGVTPLEYWQGRVAVYPKLAPVAIDLVSAPASQAFVERIFSVCGQLSSGLRNRMNTSLEQRVFLKVNRKFCY